MCLPSLVKASGILGREVKTPGRLGCEGMSICLYLRYGKKRIRVVNGGVGAASGVCCNALRGYHGVGGEEGRGGSAHELAFQKFQLGSRSFFGTPHEMVRKEPPGSLPLLVSMQLVGRAACRRPTLVDARHSPTSVSEPGRKPCPIDGWIDSRRQIDSISGSL